MLFPPWSDSEMASAPRSTQSVASRMVLTPLTMKGPPHRSRRHFTSSQVGGGVAPNSDHASPKYGTRPARSNRLGTFSSGMRPRRRQPPNQAGRDRASGASRTMVLMSRALGGDGGTPETRRGVCDQSSVTISALAPGTARGLDPRLDLLLPADPVQLEDGVRIGRDDVLDGVGGPGAQSGGRAGTRGGAGRRRRTRSEAPFPPHYLFRGPAMGLPASGIGMTAPPC